MRPILHRLFLSTLLASGLTVLLAAVFFIVLDLNSFRASSQVLLAEEAESLSIESARAVAFRKQDEAASILQARAFHDEVAWAEIRDVAGRLLASRSQAGLAPELVTRFSQRDFADPTCMVATKTVFYGGDEVGEVTLVETSDPLFGHLVSMLPLALLATALGTAFSLWLTLRFNRGVTDPLDRMVSTTQVIATSGSYGHRIAKKDEDELELSMLIDTFNNMLERVEEREQSLSEQVQVRSQLLQQEVLDRHQHDELLTIISRKVASNTGQAFYESLVEELSSGLGVDCVVVGRIDKVTSDHVDTLALWNDQRLAENIRYELKGSPCEQVISGEACFFDRGVQHKFPDDQMLADFGFESYAASPVKNVSGEAIGLVVLLDSKEMAHHLSMISLLEVIALRVAAEMQRESDDQELRKLSNAVEYSPSLISIISPDCRVEYVNVKFSEVSGYSLEDIKGSTLCSFNMTECFGLNHSCLVKNAAKTKKDWSGELQQSRKDGSTYWASVNIRPIIDEGGNVTSVLCTQEDITDQRQLSNRLTYQATHDGLTKLINRTEFERRLELYLRETISDEATSALCYLDLDQFKVVNDTSGHVAGDALLQQLAVVWKAAIRKSDVLARLGGDEFGLLVEGCELDRAVQVAEHLRALAEEISLQWEGRTYRVTVSIGVVSFKASGESVTELLKKADSACYAAKDRGRNCVYVHLEDDAALATRTDEMLWVARINEAVENDRLILYAQPMLPIGGKAPLWSHFEILVRMLGANEEITLPGAFLGAAERYGVASRIDCWVLEHALTWLRSREDLDQIDYCSINLSGISLSKGHFLETVKNMLLDSGVDPHKICFEITETAAIANIGRFTRFMDELSGLGCCFSLDDFGSGLSSFAYLKNLPVCTLKIDGVFVRDICEDPIDHAMVSSINQIGKVMGMKTVAEFVENEDILEKLKEIGVDYAQGYAVSKPIPLADIPEMLSDNQFDVGSTQAR